MAIDALQTLYVIEAMENFIAKKRPSEHIRPKLAIGFADTKTIDNKAFHLLGGQKASL